MSASFGRACASELSAATTAFLPISQLGIGGAVSSAARPQPDTREPDALATALADAAVGGSPSPSPVKTPNAFQDSLPYRTQAESSVVSDWKAHYWKEGGKGLALQRGLRFLDLRDSTHNSPGVCVVKQTDDCPKAPGSSSQFGPVKESQHIIDAYTKQLLRMGVVLKEPHDHGKSITKQSDKNSVANEVSVMAKEEAIVAMTRKARSEVSLARDSREASLLSHHERSKHLPAVVARDRYQKYIVAKPKKGHRFCEPEQSKGFEAEAMRTFGR